MRNENLEEKAVRDAANAARGKKWQYIMSHLPRESSDMEALAKMLSDAQYKHVENKSAVYYLGRIVVAKEIGATTPEALDAAVEFVKSKTES